MITVIAHDGDASMLNTVDMLLCCHMVASTICYWDRSRLVSFPYYVAVASDRLDLERHDCDPFVSASNSSWPKNLVSGLVDHGDVLVPFPDWHRLHLWS